MVCHCSGTSTQAVKKLRKLRRIFLRRQEMGTVKAIGLYAQMSMKTSPEPAAIMLLLGSWKPL